MSTYKKEKMAVLQASTLRGIVEAVNNTNNSSSKILKEDIVTLTKEDDIWILVYYI